MMYAQKHKRRLTMLNRRSFLAGIGTVGPVALIASGASAIDLPPLRLGNAPGNDWLYA